MKKADIVSGIIGLIIGSYVILKGLTYPEDFVMKIGPSFFPNFIASGLIICCVILIIQALLGKSTGEYDPLTLKNFGIRRVLVSIAALILYCAILKPFGFIPATMVFVLFFMRMFRNEQAWKYLVVPPAVTLGIYFIFEIVLKLSLPAGILSRWL